MASEALGLLPGEMQEQFIARDGVYAENAGAIFGRWLDGRIPKNEAPLLCNFWR
jgi:hypothetical protein